MNNCNLRKGNLINTYSLEKTNVDDYVFCSECGDFVYEYCAIHGPLLIIPDDEVPSTTHTSIPLSALTIPHVFLHLGASTIPGAGIGVFTTLTLPRGIRFGPYRGRKTHEVTSEYCWQIQNGKNKKSHYVDAANANNSNWMRYVNCSRHWCEQNLVAYQYKGKLYYRTIKIIPKFTELMVFYGGEFVNMLGINIQKYNSPISYLQNLGVPTSQYLEGSEENKNEEQINPQNNLTNYLLTISNEANQTKNITDNTNEKSNTAKFYITPNTSPKYLPFIANEINHSEIDNVNKLNEDYNLSKVIINEINKASTTKHTKHICNICYYETVKESLFSFHLRVHSFKNIFSCTNCKYITDRKSSLKDHIKTHTNEKEFKCDICQRKFNRYFDLNQHKKNQICQRTFECQICQTKFSSNFHLNKHVKNQICQRSFECDNCQRKFSRNSDLNQHKKNQICQRSFECQICQKTFSRNSHLNKHVKNQICQRSFECDNCQRKFSRNSDLDRHVKSQICSRTLECDICQKKFSRKSDLNRHVKRHRGGPVM